MIDPRDPDYALKRADELLDAAINRAAAQALLPVEVLHQLLLDKAHDLLTAVLDAKGDDDAD